MSCAKSGWVVLALILAVTVGCSAPQAKNPKNPDLILATTTSTQDSGLLDQLIPVFEQKTGYRVKTIAVGTGQALTMGEKGEADVLLVHSPAAEKPLVEKGLAVNRRLVMHNDFVFVGPPADPAGIKGRKAPEALRRIFESRSIFVSRGDESGTHKKEKELWSKAGIKPEGAWYQESGTGMGQTLNVASEKNGYSLTDRATYVSLKKNLKLDIMVEGDAPLLNIYHVMEVNPDRYAKVNAEGAGAFSKFLFDQDTQKLIGSFGIDKYGQALFFPDGGRTEEDLVGR